MVKMIAVTVSEVVYFTLFFILWILFFTVIYITLRVDFSGNEEYFNVPETLVALMQTYRTSIGDLQPPVYQTNLFDPTNPGYLHTEAGQGIIVVLIWMAWIINQYLNLIILLNFLIALVSEIYANAMENR